MSTLNISLPADLRALVEEQVASGRYSTHSDYVRNLIREDQDRIARDRLEAMLLARLNGEGIEVDDADWERIRRDFLRRVKADSKSHNGRRPRKPSKGAK
jgi:antitoxin ParD1/3/4